MKALPILLVVFAFGCASTPEQHEAKEQQHAIEERRRAEDDLRRKFSKYSTPELKMMRDKYADLAAHPTGRDYNFTFNPLARKIWGDSDTNNADRIIEIERELMRRQAAGD